jgi:hypothetical protein
MKIILSDNTTLERLPDDAALAARVIAIGGYADLRGYGHPLPELTSIGGKP